MARRGRRRLRVLRPSLVFGVGKDRRRMVGPLQMRLRFRVRLFRFRWFRRFRLDRWFGRIGVARPKKFRRGSMLMRKKCRLRFRVMVRRRKRCWWRLGLICFRVWLGVPLLVTKVRTLVLATVVTSFRWVVVAWRKVAPQLLRSLMVSFPLFG